MKIIKLIIVLFSFALATQSFAQDSTAIDPCAGKLPADYDCNGVVERWEKKQYKKAIKAANDAAHRRPGSAYVGVQTPAGNIEVGVQDGQAVPVGNQGMMQQQQFLPQQGIAGGGQIYQLTAFVGSVMLTDPWTGQTLNYRVFATTAGHPVYVVSTGNGNYLREQVRNGQRMSATIAQSAIMIGPNGVQQNYLIGS